MTLNVLYEDNHLLVVNKPANLPTMGAAAGEPSLAREAQAYLKHKYRKPGNVYVGVVSRLDSLVTGVIVFARTSKAAARLSEQFREGAPQKAYWGVVESPFTAPTSPWEDWLWKDDAAHRMRVVPSHASGAQRAELACRVLDAQPTTTLVEIDLRTGRKHQIRLQFAHRGWPIVGDAKYGSQRPFSPGIALHARSLTIDHPVQHQPLTIVAPLPQSWRSFRHPQIGVG